MGFLPRYRHSILFEEIILRETSGRRSHIPRAGMATRRALARALSSAGPLDLGRPVSALLQAGLGVLPPPPHPACCCDAAVASDRSSPLGGPSGRSFASAAGGSPHRGGPCWPQGAWEPGRAQRRSGGSTPWDGLGARRGLHSSGAAENNKKDYYEASTPQRAGGEPNWGSGQRRTRDRRSNVAACPPPTSCLIRLLH